MCFVRDKHRFFSSGHRAKPYTSTGGGWEKSILQAGKYDALFESAFMLDPDSETYKLADQIFAGIVEGSDANIGDLFVSYIRDGGSADILAPDENDVISDSSTGSNLVDDMVDNWNGVSGDSETLAGQANTGYNGIAGAGDVGKYTQTIKWGIQDVKVRPAGEGFFGQRTQQVNPRVDAYELKINPNNESYYLKSPSGGYVQYENMVNDVVIDGKLVIQQKSFYHVNDLPEFARNKVLQEAMRQVEAANSVGYTVEWLVSDLKAVAQLTDFFISKNIKIVVKYFPE